MTVKNDDEVKETVVRNDERIKVMLEMHNRLEKQDEEHSERLDELSDQIVELRGKILAISDKTNISDSRWNNVFDAVWKLVLTVIAAATLYVLNLK